MNYTDELENCALANQSTFLRIFGFHFIILKKLFNLFFIDLRYNETSPGSLKAIFESPKENYQTSVDSNNTNSCSKPRFVITPATLINTSNT